MGLCISTCRGVGGASLRIGKRRLKAELQTLAEEAEVEDVVLRGAGAGRGDGEVERGALAAAGPDHDFVGAGRERGGEDIDGARERFPVADVGLGAGGKRGAEGHESEAGERGAVVVSAGA